MTEQTIFPNIPLNPRTTDNTGTNIVTGLVRLSYLHVFTPQPSQQPGGKPRYTVSVLVPKSDAATLALLRKARDIAATAKWGDKVKQVVARETFKKGLRDGDIERPDDPAYKGMMFFNAGAEQQPILWNERQERITTPDELRSGDFARVNVNVFAYEKGGGIGVGFGLNSIQRVARGPALSGGPSAEQAFSDPIPGVSPSGTPGAEAAGDGGIFD